MKNLYGVTAALLLAGSVPAFAQQQAGPGTPPHSAEAGAATQNGSNSVNGSMPTGAIPHSSTPNGTTSSSTASSTDAMGQGRMAKKSSKKAHAAASTGN